MALYDRRVSCVEVPGPFLCQWAFPVNSEEVNIPTAEDQLMIGRHDEDRRTKLVSFDTLPDIQNCA